MQIYTPFTSAVPRQISEQGRLRPHDTALHHGDKDLSYGELIRRADQFAEYLRRSPAVSGRAVAICMERSFDWIIAALGIMRAGAAYVLLDPAWPDARLRFAVSDSGAVALVARTSTLERLQVGLPGIDPSRDAAAVGSSDGASDYFVALDSLAYVIYTSGSTGAPKGVEITHANLAHLVSWHHSAFGVTAQDRVSHLAGLAFDASVWEIWPNLCAGATVCIPDESVRFSPDLIQKWMLQEGITVGFVPTAHAAAMTEMGWPESTPLRLLLTGGDTMHEYPRTRLPFKVVNNYGPSECTVVSTSSILQPGGVGAPPIGCPIAGATVYILDENRRQVPAGCAGEIYIGGAGVGRGYRNLPEPTKERFLPDPFAGVPGARIYRTGDRGARLGDGQIQFLGRLDRQVKIRGERVELDEIGSALSQHPSVDFATVVTNLSAKGENQLVAYVMPKQAEPEPSAKDIQMHLMRSLPNYMVPAVFVRLDQIPLSANGKLDFALLPPPSDMNLLSTGSKSRPVTPLERHLLDIMQDLLNGKVIGVGDNFFLAGGDSLLGMQLIIMLRDKFGVELTFSQIFEAGTVGSLAILMRKSCKNVMADGTQDDLLRSKHARPEESDKLEVCEQGGCAQRIGESKLSAGVLPLQKCEPHKMIFWLHYPDLNLHKTLGTDQQVILLALTQEDMELLGDTPRFESIAKQFVRKILGTQPGGPYTIGGSCIGGVLAYEVAIQLRVPRSRGGPTDAVGSSTSFVSSTAASSKSKANPATLSPAQGHEIGAANDFSQEP